MSRIPPSRLPPFASRLVRSTRLAHLATADARGHPHVMPVCFVFDGKYFYTPIDEKPKRLAPQNLKRLKNINANPNVALLVDRYEEDWRRLAYVLVRGSATVLTKGARHACAVGLLRKKYRQYGSMEIHRRPMIAIRPTRVISWAAGSKASAHALFR